jgi:hypothetical protein
MHSKKHNRKTTEKLLVNCSSEQKSSDEKQRPELVFVEEANHL